MKFLHKRRKLTRALGAVDVIGGVSLALHCSGKRLNWFK